MDAVTRVHLAGHELRFVDVGQDSWLQGLKAGNTSHLEKMSLSLWQVLSTRVQCVLDIGSFNGMYSLLATVSNKSVRALAVEPMPMTYGVLCLNALLNGVDNRLTAVNAAASSISGRATVASPSGAYVMSSGESLLASDGAYTYDTPTLRLDDIWELRDCFQGWPIEKLRASFDLVKVDVEGFEAEVLRGMHASIRAAKQAPDLIVEMLSEESFAEVTGSVDWGAEFYFIDDLRGQVNLQHPYSFGGPGNYWITQRNPSVVQEIVLAAMDCFESKAFGLVPARNSASTYFSVPAMSSSGSSGGQIDEPMKSRGRGMPLSLRERGAEECCLSPDRRNLGLVIDKAWGDYYAMSPYRNLLDSSGYGMKTFHVSKDIRNSDPDAWDEILSCDGLAVSVGLEQVLRDSFDGPILSIGDDIHRFDKAGMDVLLTEIQSCDLFLTPYALARPYAEHPYWYLPADIKSSRLAIYPNCAPAGDLSESRAQERRALLTGRVNKVYPVRECMLEVGANLVEQLEFKELLGEAYFQEVGRYRIGLTCNSWLDSTVAKYYEIPWAGSLLMAPLPKDPLERTLLGFEDSVNMLAVAASDFERGGSKFRAKLNWALSSEEADQIQLAGRDLVREMHTVRSRIQYLIALLMRILDGGFHVDDQFDIFMRASPIRQPAGMANS